MGSQDIVLRWFSIAIMTESKKGQNLVNILRNSLISEPGYLNINPKSYAIYQYPSSNGSQDIVLARFSLLL